LTGADGTKFKLKPPKIAPEIPEKGFNDISRDDIYDAPAEDSRSIEVTINKDSVRLQ
jgi:aconitate hydratase